jgi:ADP-ribosyl-[dinitrogen reductase] hydrolase
MTERTRQITRPINDAYVVPNSTLAAGAYPGSRPGTPLQEAESKIAAFLRAGITVFIDLTDPADRLEPYEPMLRRVAADAGVDVQYRRMAIRDMDVCSREHMNDVLEVIDDHLVEGRGVYVHCWGGVGRTGMVVGCWLVRRYLSGPEALEQVQSLFNMMSATKRRRHAAQGSPQTEAQREMVRKWADLDASRSHQEVALEMHRLGLHIGAEEWARIAPRPDVTFELRDRMRGALIGLAVGDAVGTTVEFRSPGSFEPVTDMVGGGPFRLEPGQWTDDTSMALCIAHSLVECRDFDALDQMQRYCRWRDEGYLSSNGRCFDVGNTVRRALRAFEHSGNPMAGPTAEHTAGNGSLMRLAPIPMFFSQREDVLTMAAQSSRTTHGAPVAVDCCRYLAALIVGAINGRTKDELLAPHFSPFLGCWESDQLHPVVATIADGSYKSKSPPEIRGTGYAADALEAALWAFYRSTDFEDGCLLAVNLGNDADTTAAIYGQLAGAHYGERGIPNAWRERLAHKPMLDRTAELIFQLAFDTAPAPSRLRAVADVEVEMLLAEAGGDADAALMNHLNAEKRAKAEMGAFAYHMNGPSHAQALREEVHLLLRVTAALAV